MSGYLTSVRDLREPDRSEEEKYNERSRARETRDPIANRLHVRVELIF